MKSKLKKSHRHPPQPKRNFISHKAEANKSLVIGIIAVIAIVGLGLLLFFSKQFVGQAVKMTPYEPTDGEAGIFIKDASVEVEDTFSVPVKVNIGNTKSVAVGFELTYPKDALTADCSKIFEVMDAKFTGTTKGDLAVIKTADCTLGKIIFEYAGLCNDLDCSNAITGNTLIAEVSFTANAIPDGGIANLIFSDQTFTVIDLSSETDEDLVGAGYGIGVGSITIKGGTTKFGGNCTSNSDCASGACYVIPKKGGFCSAPTCKSLLIKWETTLPLAKSCDAGVSCNQGTTCVNNLYCVADAELETFKKECQGTFAYCSLMAGLGNPCAKGIGECQADSECATGFFCFGTNPDYDPGIKTCAGCDQGVANQCAISGGTTCNSDNSQVLSCVSTSCGNKMVSTENCTAAGKVCKEGKCVSPAQVCGNGVIEETETCDGSLFKQNCTDFGFSGGASVCNDCSADYSSCTLSNEKEPCYLISGLPALQGITSTCKAGLTCNLGICVKQENAATLTCGDTDAYLPNEFFVKGTVKTKSPKLTLIDSCGAGNVLTERACVNGTNISLEVSCPLDFGLNYSCQDGACIKSGFKCKIAGQDKKVGSTTSDSVCANRVMVNQYVNMSFIKDLTCGEVYRGVPIVKVQGLSGALYQYLKINPSNKAFASGTFTAVNNSFSTLCPGEIVKNPGEWSGSSTADPLASTLAAAERCIDEGKFQFLFYQSSCIADAPLSCPSGKECCGGITEISLQTDVNNCGVCNKKCSQGETCQSGTCAVATLGKCTDPDNTYTPSFNENNASFNSSSLLIAATVNGFNIVTGNQSSIADQCSWNKSITEVFCWNETHIYLKNWDCPSGTSCSMGACIAPPFVSLITLEVTNKSGGGLVQIMSKSNSYSVKATLKATNIALAPHLFFVKVLDSQGKDASVHYEPKLALVKSGEETLSFDYTPLSNGNYTIKAFAWSDWLSLGGAVIDNAYAVGNYEVK